MKLKTIFKLITIAILIIMLFPYSTTLAATVEEVGNAIGTFALNYYEKKGTPECPYVNWSVSGNLYERRAVENGPLTTNGAYEIDCVGWVNFCVYQAAGIKKGEDLVMSGSGGYVVPSQYDTYKSRTSFDVEDIGPSAVEELQTGDIVITNSHVMVFVNNNGVPTFIHSYTTDGGPSMHTWDNLPGKYKDNLVARARVKESVASEINSSDLKTNPLLNGSGRMGSVQKSDFFYNGIPDGKYSVTAGIEDFLLLSLADIFDYLIGIITLSQRMPFIGWTSIVENIVSDTIKKVEEKAEDYQGKEQDPISTDVEEDLITLETIIFNRLKVLDINFFKPTVSESVGE